MSLSVALLRNCNDWTSGSSNLYADRLARGLAEAGVPCLDFAGPWPWRSGRILRPLEKAEQYVTRYWRYPRALRSVRADLYHIVDHANAHWLRALPAERAVVTCHDLILLKLAAGEIPWRGRLPWTATSAFRWSVSHLPHAGAVLCVSQSTKEDAARLLGCAPERLHVVHHGVHEAFRQPRDPAARVGARRILGLTGPVTVLHVGHNFFYKNLEGTIEAMALLPRSWRPRIQLVKVGQPFTPAQQRLIRRRGLSGQVRFLGQPGLQDLVLLYHAADLLLFPSLSEGFGWPPLEAMASGTPVVCSDRGGLREVVGDAACLVNPDDPADILRGMLQVLEDDRYREELVTRGLEQVKRFRWDRALQQIRLVYESLLDGQIEAPTLGTHGPVVAQLLRLA